MAAKTKEKASISFSLKKDEIDKISKFASINPKMYLYPDRIQVINGTMDGGKNRDKTKSAVYMLENPYNFEEKIGFIEINNLLSTVKLFKEHVIDVYEKYVIVRNLENTVKIKLWLTPETLELIPVGDVESGYQKATQIENSTHFIMGWDLIKRINDIKTSLNKDFCFVNIQNGKINIKIDNEFEENSNDVANITIDEDSIEKDSLKSLKDGDYIKWKFDMTSFVEDNYRVIMLERALVLCGLNSKVKYIFAMEEK